jgi:hypothetical protein
MDWKKERDLLIAQTLAFVQSVSNKKLNAQSAIEAPPDFAAGPTDATERTEIVGAPEETGINIQIPRAIAPSDIRAEIQDRVAHFRAHQQRFKRERDEYFSATLAKLRATLRDGTTPLH